jgi:hypothetical protein
VTKYSYQFDFDCEGDPPKVEICEGRCGPVVLEVHEEPTCTHESGWSWDPDHWELGPFATRVLDLLNAPEGPGGQEAEAPK